MRKQKNMLGLAYRPVVDGLLGELHISAKLTEVFSHSPKEDGRCVTKA